MKYDPHVDMDAAVWQALDEGVRMEAVIRYHRRKGIRLPNAQMHAVIHTVVENQIAEGDTLPTRATLVRLMKEGLDRHEAVHAIGSVVAADIFRILKEKTPHDPVAYAFKLARLTPESWRKQSQPPEAD
jgi:hypothetical protein